MNANFKVPQPGTDPLSTDAGQYALALGGSADVGQMKLVAPQATPAAPIANASGSSGNLNGNYCWVVVLVTGWQQSDGSYYVNGFAPSVASAALTIANNSASLSGIATGSAGTIGRAIYRPASGAASSTARFVGIIWDNATTTFTDNISDANLGTGMPTGNSTPAAYGTAIPAAVPTGNSTGTSIAGINALAHGPSLLGLWHFENDVNSSRGARTQFSRGSVANDPTTLATINGNNTPRFQPGKFGNGLFVEESTTNLVYNSDFETVTGTGTMFSDPLTSGTAWTAESGSFTFGSNGATCGATGSLMTAGNPSWKPLTGSNGSPLSLTAQATFTTPATVPTYMSLKLFIDNNNKYELIWQSDNNLVLYKTVAGVSTSLGSDSVAVTQTASTTYTLTLSLAPNGTLTVKLYSGTGTGGTLLQTFTATDTSLAGGFLIGVGGDSSVEITQASVSAPKPDGWSIGGDQRVAWSLTSGAISGLYSISAVGVASVEGYVTQSISSVSQNVGYTLSGYANSQNLGTNGAYLELDFGGSSGFLESVITSTLTGTATKSRLTKSGTSPTGTTGGNLFCICHDSGVVVFDAIQIEQKAYATSYLRNDSASSNKSRSGEVLSLPSLGVFSDSAWTISLWFMTQVLTGANQTVIKAFTDSNNQYIVRLNSSGQIELCIIQAGNAVLLDSQTAVSKNTLYHMAVTGNGSTASLYVNGTLVDSKAYTKPSAPTTIYVGANEGTSAQINGVIDELSIFSRVLSDAEVFSLYYANIPLQDALANPIAPDIASYSSFASSPDNYDVYTSVQYKRRDGTIYMVSTASNPDANGNYQTITWQYYDATGTVVTSTTTWLITYDAYGKPITKVMQ